MSNEIPNTTLYREMALDRRAIDDEARTVPASLSSEIEVERFFGKEVLVHESKAVNLERAAEGLPLLFGHNQDQPIGLVEDVRVEGGKLRGLLRFSDNPRASEIWPDVRDGFLKNISIGYRVNKWEEQDDSDVVRITSWTLFEASIVTVPADHGVGVNRSQGNTAMTDKPEIVAENRATWLASEKKRRTEIRELFRPFQGRGVEYMALMEASLDSPDVSTDTARRQLFELWGGDAEPLSRDYLQAEGSANGQHEQATSYRNAMDRRVESFGGQRVTGMNDHLGDFRAAAVDALVQRGGVPVKDPHPAAIDVGRMRMSDIAQIFCDKANISIRGISRAAVIDRALSTRGLISHSTSDFASLLEDVATKSMLVGYAEAPATHRAWTRIGSLPDFKTGKRVTLADFDNLDQVVENGEYRYGSVGDYGASITLATYGKLFSISRQALVNDDVGGFTAIPAGMARAALRIEEDLVWNILIGGVATVTMPDGDFLFHANHSNYVAPGAGAAPSVATLDAAFTSMGTQTGPGGNAILNVVPRFLLVPHALKSTAQVMVASLTDPDGATVSVANPYHGKLEVIADARLDANDPLAWYLAADPMATDTVEIAFLDGQQAPYLESQNGWTTDGVSYKVRHDCGVAALDFRGLYMNDGN